LARRLISTFISALREKLKPAGTIADIGSIFYAGCSSSPPGNGDHRGLLSARLA
jgi:hypothetical protein